jgi:hypothetical protein
VIADIARDPKSENQPPKALPLINADNTD